MINEENNLTHLTIRRKRQLMEGNIPVDILINGFLAGQIKSGETKTIKVYTQDVVLLEAKMMMNKTKAFTVSAEEREKNIYEVSHVISNPVYIIGIVLAICSTILVFTTGHPGYMVLVAPPAALFAYFKFLKKDRYLRITQTEGQPSFQYSKN